MRQNMPFGLKRKNSSIQNNFCMKATLFKPISTRLTIMETRRNEWGKSVFYSRDRLLNGSRWIQRLTQRRQLTGNIFSGSPKGGSCRKKNCQDIRKIRGAVLLGLYQFRLIDQENLAQGFVDLADVDRGVETGTKGTVVEDADHREGIAVLDA